MSPSRIAIPVSFLVLLLSVATCKKSNPGSERLAPLPLSEFRWGESLDENEVLLIEKGFQRLNHDSEGEAHFSFQPPDVDSDNLPGVNPYEITLFARKNQLVAARYIRRDIPENLGDYSSKLKSSNGLKQVWKSGKSVTNTPAGNRIAEQTMILENEEFLVKNTHTQNTGAEERFAAGLNDELETQIYALEHNEGISADRLKPEGQ